MTGDWISTSVTVGVLLAIIIIVYTRIQGQDLKDTMIGIVDFFREVKSG